MKGVLKRIQELRGTWPLTRFCREVGLNYEALKQAFRRDSIPDTATLCQIAGHFHIDLAWLISGESGSRVWLKELGQRLLTFRQQQGLTLEAMAETAGLAPKVYQWYEAGSGAMALDYLPALCQRLNLPAFELFHDASLPYPAPELRVQAPGNLNQAPPVRGEDYVSIPLTDSAIAAGQPIIQENNIQDYVLLHVRAAGRRTNLVASRVDGDSMEPMLTSGDIVVIDRNDKKITKNKMYAIFYEEGLTAKYLERQGAWLILRPVNPNARVQIVNLLEQADPVVGRIIGAWKEF